MSVISCHNGFGYDTPDIPKQFPLIYLGKTAEGYKYAFPYSLADNSDNADNSSARGHEKYILIQLHNRLSQYNTENSSYMHGYTETSGTRIYRDSYGVGGTWPATNKIILSLAVYDRKIYPNLTSTERTPQDTAKVYYYKHIANEIEAVPMIFEFLETVRQCTTEVEDKPEETPNTPDNITPEGVLTPYTVKVRFTPDYWYRDGDKFAAYCIDTQSWKEATKVVGDVVYYTFTEEEATNNSTWKFTKHSSNELAWHTNVYQTEDIEITFEDTIMDDVVTINHYNTTAITVGKAYV